MATAPDWINAISAGIKAISVLKIFFKKSPPEESARKEVLEAVEEIEKGFNIAQLKLAEELGYGLCKKHWPPVIMLSKGNLYDPYTEQFECTECGAIWPGKDPAD